MNAVAWVLIAVCVVLETVEQVCFRHGSGNDPDTPRRARPGSIVAGMTLNLVGMAVWLVVLRGVPLGQAMPLLAANNVTVALAGAWLFRERISPRRWLGIFLITAGVALVGSETA